MSRFYIKKQAIRNIVNIASWIMMLFIVIGRLICGCHWFTDIVGGVIISLALLNIFNALLLLFEEKKQNNEDTKKRSKK